MDSLFDPPFWGLTQRAAAWVLAGAASVLMHGQGWSAPPAVSAAQRAEIEARYQQERAACAADSSLVEPAACQLEARRARTEALRGRLAAGDPPPDVMERNAIERCRTLTGEDQQLCVRRLGGEARISGSVAAGGLLRELTIQVPAP